MNMKTEPWIEDSDPLKPYYGKLSNQEYTDISNIFIRSLAKVVIASSSGLPVQRLS